MNDDPNAIETVEVWFILDMDMRFRWIEVTEADAIAAVEGNFGRSVHKGMLCGGVPFLSKRKRDIVRARHER